MASDLYQKPSQPVESSAPPDNTPQIPPDRFRLRFAPAARDGERYAKVTFITGMVAAVPPLLQVLGLGARSGPLHWFAASLPLGLVIWLWGSHALAREQRRATTSWGLRYAAWARRWWRILMITSRAVFMAEIVLFLWVSLDRLGLQHGSLADAGVMAMALLIPVRHALLVRAQYAETLGWLKWAEAVTALTVSSIVVTLSSILATYAAPEGMAYLRPGTAGVAIVWIVAAVVVLITWLVTLGRLLQQGTAPARPRRAPPPATEF